MSDVKEIMKTNHEETKKTKKEQKKSMP